MPSVIYLSEVLRSLCFQNIATRPINKFENTVKSYVKFLGIDLSFGCGFCCLSCNTINNVLLFCFKEQVLKL